MFAYPNIGVCGDDQSHRLRQEVLKLQGEIVNDPYLAGVPSLEKTRVALHAKDDLPEVRYRVFKGLAELDHHAQFIVARKVEKRCSLPITRRIPDGSMTI